MQKYKRHIIYFSFAIVLLIIACSPETTHRTLTFFFDGVPDMDYSDDIISNDSLNQTDSTEILIIADAIKTPENYLHKPYAEKDCKSCHNNEMGTLMNPQPDLCYSCHDNFEEQYTKLHNPVTEGKCTSCHNPHRSKHEDLLNNTGKDLCIKCHESVNAEEDIIHSKTEISNCIECHDPHGEETTSFLKAGKCFSCHDDFSKTYNHIHGPVAAGYCHTCHDNHLSKRKFKLQITGQELCLDCHNKKSVFKNKNHKGKENNDCLECHNPHGGDDKNILISNN